MSKVIDSTNLGHLWDLIKQYADGAVAAIASKLVPSGGTTGQVLAKASGTDWDLAWVNQSGGGGSSPTMEDTDVDAAVEAAWPGYLVTISLTHPLYGENFNKCQIEGYADGGNITDILGLIIDPAGSMTVAFDSDTYEYLSLMFDARWGASFMESNITCTGGVSYYTETAMTNRLFVVTGSGTITINGIDYDD